METSTLEKALNSISSFVSGPVMLVLLVGTGIFLTIKLHALPWRNLGSSLRTLFSKESRQTTNGEGDISPFSALMTALASTVGTGNIVGVATAMVLGGPGALVWMWISALFGISTKYAECALAVKYRTTNSVGEMSGGPMYTIKNSFKNKGIATFLSCAFAVFTVLASFGIGNTAQANSIASAVNNTFNIPLHIVGIVLALFIGAVVIGGIQSISKVSSVIVPFMAVFYIVIGIAVILINIKQLPEGIILILKSAFGYKQVGAGITGTITASMMQSIRSGVSRGVFSNEAGLGSAAITAASAVSDHYVKQGYINMCGTFIDTIVVCTITGLTIAASGVYGTVNEAGEILNGADLTIAAFNNSVGSAGSIFVTISIILFASSTILGWEYSGEKALEFLINKPVVRYIYRVIFTVIVFFGATAKLDIVWTFSDIANNLMAIPNLISLIVLSGILSKETIAFQKEYKASLKKDNN